MTDEQSTKGSEANTPDAPTELISEMKTTRSTIEQLPHDESTVYCVPAWGYSGNGKTSALLTLYTRGSDSLLGFEIGYIDQASELRQISESPAYGNDLSALARRTKERFEPLVSRFSDNSEKPKGNNSDEAYLFTLQTLQGSAGFVFMPDLQGGSIEDSGDAAIAVLDASHGCAMLIDAPLFVGVSAAAIRYRRSAKKWIASCKRTKVPLAVMLSKCDVHSREDVDRAEEELKARVEGSDTMKLFRTSIVNVPVSEAERAATSDKLPPVDERDPIHLLAAWQWLFSKVLESEKREVQGKPPPFDLRPRPMSSERITGERTAELRAIAGPYSGFGGTIIDSLPDSSSGEARYLYEDKGKLFYLVWELASSDRPRLVSWTDSEDLIPPNDLQFVRVRSEHVFASPTSGIGAIWHGPIGSALTRRSLPYDVETWTPVGADRIVAVDSRGRASILTVDGEEDWAASPGPLQNFLELGDTEEPLPVALVTSSQGVLGFVGGEEPEAVRVEIESTATFGTRFDLGTVAHVFTTPLAAHAHLIVSASADEDDEETLTCVPLDSDADPITLGALHLPFLVAAHPVLPIVAWRASAEEIRVADIHDEGAFMTLRFEATAPRAMCWHPTKSDLLVAFDDGTVQVYRTFGLENDR